MLRRWWWVLVVIVVAVLGLVVFVRDAQAPASPTAALPLTKTFDQSPTGFTLKYPGEWEYVIPTVGVAVLGLHETLYQNQFGPTFTIQRALPLSVVGTLDEALDRYLQNGPLRTPDRWHIVEAVQTTELEGRDARVVVIEGADGNTAPALHMRIIATSADNTFVYYFVTSVPVENEATYANTFDAILASVRILE